MTKPEKSEKGEKNKQVGQIKKQKDGRHNHIQGSNNWVKTKIIKLDKSQNPNTLVL